MKTIQRIEPKIQQNFKRKKVAAYCRVSEEKGRTLHSMSTQVSYYSKLIQRNPEWEYVGVYSDLGVSGTSTKRLGFQEMIEDCKTGKIDMILTKSISRFARNTVDLLETVRWLKSIGIGVQFEKEKIDSLSDDGELMLSLLASFAQEESRSISENVKWAIRKNFKKGIGNNFILYGYRWDGKKFNLVEEEAKVIKLCFENFLNGLSAEKTEKQLRKMGVKSLTGKEFSASSVRAILVQEKYTGNSLLQKSYTENHITHRERKNKGELPMYWVENTHPAIISQETFDKVQAEIARRRELGARANPALNSSAFTSRIECGLCGKKYRRSTRISAKKKKTYAWTCQTKDQKGITACYPKDIPEDKLKVMCCKALGIDEFDEDVFEEKVEKIVAGKEQKIQVHFKDGSIATESWILTGKKDWWTPERRKSWSEQNKHKATSVHRTRGYEFTGFIKCGYCGSNYRCQSTTLKNGTVLRKWQCSERATKCDRPKRNSIRHDIMEMLVVDVLGLETFSEAQMDEQLEKAVIKNSEATFYFKDGTTQAREFSSPKVGTRWSEEAKIKMSQTMTKKWRERLGKENNNHSSND